MERHRCLDDARQKAMVFFMAQAFLSLDDPSHRLGNHFDL